MSAMSKIKLQSIQFLKKISKIACMCLKFFQSILCIMQNITTVDPIKSTIKLWHSAFDFSS